MVLMNHVGRAIRRGCVLLAAFCPLVTVAVDVVCGQERARRAEMAQTVTGLGIARLRPPVTETVRCWPQGEEVDMYIIPWNDSKSWWTAEFEIVYWLRKPLAWNDSTVAKRRFRNHGRGDIYVYSQIASLEDKFVLMEVEQNGVELLGRRYWITSQPDARRIRAVELQGLKDVGRLSAEAGLAGKARRFREVAAKGPQPSLVLVLHGFELLRPSVPDELRHEIARGLVSILLRQDSPQYVREAASQRAQSIIFADDEEARKNNAFLLTALVDAFRKGMSEAADDTKRMRTLLDTLSALTTRFCGDSSMKPTLEQLSRDLEPYGKQLKSSKDQATMRLVNALQTRLRQCLRGRPERAVIDLP